MTSFAIGDVTVTRVTDGQPDPIGEEFFAGPARDAFARCRRWLDPRWEAPSGQPAMVISGFVLSAGGRNVLVDSGVGDWPSPGRAAGSEPSDFLRALARAGFTPADIHVVINTHLHFDHVGGNTRAAPGGAVAATFPNAEYLVGAADWAAHGQVPAGSPALSTVGLAVRPLVDSGQARLVGDGYHACPQVSVLATPGHTAGHLSVVVASRGQEAVVTGDLAHHPVQLAVPEVGSAFDEAPDIAAATRGRLASEWAARGTVVLGSHFPGAGVGVIERDGDELRYAELRK